MRQQELKTISSSDWKHDTSKGFFFRAEDFSAFVDSVEQERSKLAAQFRDLEGNVSDAVIRQLSDNANYSLRQMGKEYGENMLAFSHGEAYLKILQTRIVSKGIYLLDEPEAALSPLKQLSLIVFILEVLKDAMQQVEFTDTEHYRITKNFLDNPRIYLRHLE